MLKQHIRAMFSNTALTVPALYRNAAGDIIPLRLKPDLLPVDAFGFDGGPSGSFEQYKILSEDVASPKKNDRIAVNAELADLDANPGLFDGAGIRIVKEYTPDTAYKWKLRVEVQA